jgi:hypothetical protein
MSNTKTIEVPRSTELFSFIVTARRAVQDFKKSQDIGLLIDVVDDAARDAARLALGTLREFGEANPGVRTALLIDEGNISVNGIDAWEAIVAGCGIKGGTAHVRKGKMSNVKAAGKAIMADKG